MKLLSHSHTHIGSVLWNWNRSVLRYYLSTTVESCALQQNKHLHFVLLTLLSMSWGAKTEYYKYFCSVIFFSPLHSLSDQESNMAGALCFYFCLWAGFLCSVVDGSFRCFSWPGGIYTVDRMEFITLCILSLTAFSSLLLSSHIFAVVHLAVLLDCLLSTIAVRMDKNVCGDHD